MGRLLVRLGLVSVVVTSLTVVAGVPAAHAATSCPPDIVDTTVSGNVVVPAGQSCLIQSSTVSGNVTVQPGADLLIVSSTIGGSVTATSPHGFVITAFRGGANSSIGGSVNVSGTTGTHPLNGTDFVCATHVGSGVTIQNSGPGAQWHVGNCSPNVPIDTGGNLTLSQNQSRIDVDSNSIGGNLSANGNSGGGDVSNNQIRGGLTLTNVPPCWTQSSNTVGGARNTPC